MRADLKIILITIMLLLIGTPVWACGVCMDQGIAIRFPFAGYIPVLGILWLAVVAIIGSCWSQAACDHSAICPSRKQLVRYALLGALGYSVLWIITLGSFIGSGFVVGMVWVVHVMLKTKKFGFKGFRRLRGDGLSQGCLAVNFIFLFLIAVSIPFSYVRAHSTEGLIAKLHYDIPDKGRVVLPALIAQGDAAVDPLMIAMRRSLAHDGEYERMNTVSSAAYCLEKIGGNRASAYLGEVVRAQEELTGYMDLQWQRAVCFAYGECGGTAAVPDLVAFYNRATGEESEQHRWAILSALVRTRTRQGIEFVFDHMDVLVERADGGRDGRETEVARATVVTLFTQKVPNALKDIPSGSAIGIRGLQWRDEPFMDIRQVWATSGTEIRKRWLEVLK